jgi:hypothetical protein
MAYQITKSRVFCSGCPLGAVGRGVVFLFIPKPRTTRFGGVLTSRLVRRDGNLLGKPPQSMIHTVARAAHPVSD